MDKPILFIDVDGVLFGVYGPYQGPQLRPNVVSFLDWAVKNFTCVWLTSFPGKKLYNLFRCMYAQHIYEKTEYRRWGPDKEDAVDLAGDFYWIEDDPLWMHPKLEDLKDDYGFTRYIEVNPYGEESLDRTKQQLMYRLLARGYTKGDAII